MTGFRSFNNSACKTIVNLCFTLSVESTACFSPSTSSESLCLWLTCSCTYHIIFLCCLTTLVIHVSFTLGLKPTCFTSLSHHSLSFSLKTTSTDCYPECFIWATRFFGFSPYATRPLSVLSCPVLSCLWRWCIVAKRLDGSRWNFACG